MAGRRHRAQSSHHSPRGGDGNPRVSAAGRPVKGKVLIPSWICRPLEMNHRQPNGKPAGCSGPGRSPRVLAGELEPREKLRLPFWKAGSKTPTRTPFLHRNKRGAGWCRRQHRGARGCFVPVEGWRGVSQPQPPQCRPHAPPESTCAAPLGGVRQTHEEHFLVTRGTEKESRGHFKIVRIK